jgi:hypothetical protein
MLSTIKISKEALAEFKAIYKDEFVDELSDERAAEIASRLLRLFFLLSEQPVDPTH